MQGGWGGGRKQGQGSTLTNVSSQPLLPLPRGEQCLTQRPQHHQHTHTRLRGRPPTTTRQAAMRRRMRAWAHDSGTQTSHTHTPQTMHQHQDPQDCEAIPLLKANRCNAAASARTTPTNASPGSHPAQVPSPSHTHHPPHTTHHTPHTTHHTPHTTHHTPHTTPHQSITPPGRHPGQSRTGAAP